MFECHIHVHVYDVYFANMNSLTFNSQLPVQSTHKPFIIGGFFFHNYLQVILAILTFTFKLGEKNKNKTSINYVGYSVLQCTSL